MMNLKKCREATLFVKSDSINQIYVPSAIFLLMCCCFVDAFLDIHIAHIQIIKIQ